MRRRITEIPYVPHRYADELPDTAFGNYAVWRDALIRDERGARSLAIRLDVDAFRTGSPVAGVRDLTNFDEMFVAVAGGIEDIEDATERSRTIRDIFGSLAEREVEDLIEAVVMQDEARNLQARILYRVDRGSYTDADLAWIRRQAAQHVTDDDFAFMDPFQGDESEVTVLSRRVVRARREHRCHWTGLPIPVGERHLVLRETADGEFVTTRHSLVAAWFSAYADDPTLAEMLKRDEPLDARRAA